MPKAALARPLPTRQTRQKGRLNFLYPATAEFWEGATPHTGVAELRAKRGRPAKAPEDRKEQIALRLDREVLAVLRATGPGWQTRVNTILRERFAL